MPTHDLRSFLAQLEHTGDLRRVAEPVSPHLEMTALCDRVLRAGGPALLFENPTGHSMPVLGNLFGTHRAAWRAPWAWTAWPSCARFGEVLAVAQGARGAQGLQGNGGPEQPAQDPVEHGAQRALQRHPARNVVWEGADVDLARLPIQHCWPDDVAPLITWGLVITQRAAQGAAKPGHLPPAGAVAQPAHHALAGAPRRRARFSRALPPAPRPALPGGRGHWAPTRPPSWARSRPCPTASPNTSSPACCAVRAPRWPKRWACRSRYRPSPRSCSKATSTPMPHTPAAGSTRSKARTATTPATTTNAPNSRCSRWTASRMRRDADLPLHLHRQATRRTGRARAWR